MWLFETPVFCPWWPSYIHRRKIDHRTDSVKQKEAFKKGRFEQCFHQCSIIDLLCSVWIYFWTWNMFYLLNKAIRKTVRILFKTSLWKYFGSKCVTIFQYTLQFPKFPHCKFISIGNSCLPTLNIFSGPLLPWKKIRRPLYFKPCQRSTQK